MKSKLILVLSMIFLIAIIYDTLQVLQHGMTNNTIRFYVNYVLNIGGFLSIFFLYKHYKKK